tara:strand:- start:775 stop:1284 length:510 start_codon:yes stop_codon:yes gene_type:complete
MKWIGKHIFNLIATFRRNVVFEAKTTMPIRVYDLPGTTIGDYTSGDIVYFGGTTSMTKGKIYYLNNSGGWTLSNADSATDASGMLAVALGSSSDNDGMLLRGVVTLFELQGSEDHGQKVYLNAVDGATAVVAPSTSGHVVRVVGYSLGNTSTNSDAVYFNPDNTYVELA